MFQICKFYHSFYWHHYQYKAFQIHAKYHLIETACQIESQVCIWCIHFEKQCKKQKKNLHFSKVRNQCLIKCQIKLPMSVHIAACAGLNSWSEVRHRIWKPWRRVRRVLRFHSSSVYIFHGLCQGSGPCFVRQKPFLLNTTWILNYVMIHVTCFKFGIISICSFYRRNTNRVLTSMKPLWFILNVTVLTCNLFMYIKITRSNFPGLSFL